MVLQILLLAGLLVEPRPLLANVPNLVGGTVSQAVTTLQPMGLQLQIAGGASVAANMSSIIDSQNPVAGTAVPSPIPIGYFISVVLRPLPPDPNTFWEWVRGHWYLVVALLVVLIIGMFLIRRRGRASP